MVRERITALEDAFTERKPDGTSRSDLRRTLVGFANSVPEGRTAILYIGVGNNGEILGVANSDALQKTIRSIAEGDCYPPVLVTSEVVTIDGKNVVAVVVPHSTNRPHFSGHAYVRRGSETIVASRELFEELIASRHSKAGAILALKEQVVTVIALRKELGSTKYLGDNSYRARHECSVKGCTPQFVQLYDISTGHNVSEPLANVTVSHDEERHRPMLIVQPV